MDIHSLSLYQGECKHIDWINPVIFHYCIYWMFSTELFKTETPDPNKIFSAPVLSVKLSLMLKVALFA